MDDWMIGGTAIDEGMGGDVEMYDETGTPASSQDASGFQSAVVLVVVSLAALWVMGAYVFKGSNQS